MESKEQPVRDKILRIHHENKDLSHRSIAKTLGIANSTVSRVIKRFEERLTTDRKPRSEGKSIPYNTKNHNRVVGAFNRNPNASVRDVAKKLHLSRSFVQKAKTKAGLRTFKVQKALNRDEKQNKSGKTRARKLYLNMLTKVECCIMDDETYVKADFKQIPGNLFFTAKDKFSVPEHVRTQKMSKFPGLASHLHVREAECTFRDPGHDERTGVHKRVPPEAAASSPEGPQRPNNLLAGFGLMPLLQGRAEVVCGQ
ncbi:uncharacterized protein LOC135710154 [Ochlerotatus camptorhynchus]|uniref:uncharacterized protein LOC135710154 n=1 Tax=Ochlerotatus camptorhynchus TaxID=644619 RepID=UPI0031DE09E2